MKFTRLTKSIRKSTADIWSLFAPPRRGIDLDRRSTEVARIFYAHFASQILREGYEPDDVLQDIYTGLMMRNKGVNPYNPEVAKFGHYVYMVCRSVWINYRNKYGRHRKATTPFFGTTEGDEFGEIDAGSANVEGVDYHKVVDLNLILESVAPEDREILVSLAEGYSKADVVNQGHKRSKIQSVLDRARIYLDM